MSGIDSSFRKKAARQQGGDGDILFYKRKELYSILAEVELFEKNKSKSQVFLKTLSGCKERLSIMLSIFEKAAARNESAKEPGKKPGEIQKEINLIYSLIYRVESMLSKE